MKTHPLRKILLFSFYFFALAENSVEKTHAESASISYLPSFTQSSTLTKNSLVLACEYADFLNHVCKSDPQHFYDQQMSTTANSSDSHYGLTLGPIIQLGTPGNFHYEVLAGKENFPISYMNEFSQKAFSDWSQQKLLIVAEHQNDAFLRSSTEGTEIINQTPELSLFHKNAATLKNQNSPLALRDTLYFGMMIAVATMVKGGEIEDLSDQQPSSIHQGSLSAITEIPAHLHTENTTALESARLLLNDQKNGLSSQKRRPPRLSRAFNQVIESCNKVIELRSEALELFEKHENTRAIYFTQAAHTYEALVRSQISYRDALANSEYSLATYHYKNIEPLKAIAAHREQAAIVSQMSFEEAATLTQLANAKEETFCSNPIEPPMIQWTQNQSINHDDFLRESCHDAARYENDLDQEKDEHLATLLTNISDVYQTVKKYRAKAVEAELLKKQLLATYYSNTANAYQLVGKRLKYRIDAVQSGDPLLQKYLTREYTLQTDYYRYIARLREEASLSATDSSKEAIDAASLSDRADKLSSYLEKLITSFEEAAGYGALLTRATEESLKNNLTEVEKIYTKILERRNDAFDALRNNEESTALYCDTAGNAWEKVSRFKIQAYELRTSQLVTDYTKRKISLFDADADRYQKPAEAKDLAAKAALKGNNEDATKWKRSADNYEARISRINTKTQIATEALVDRY